jgi:hypothetical protein
VPQISHPSNLDISHFCFLIFKMTVSIHLMNKMRLFTLAITVGLSLICLLPAESLPLVAAARTQIGVTKSYDPAYTSLKYPEGDVASDRGVCTDVVIRALRRSHQLDLQKLVHEDMSANFSLYPKRWGLKKTDKNIDHRRVLNLQTYFKRQGWSQLVTQKKEDYLPGDLVTSLLPGNLPHIMIVSDKKNAKGVPLVIHNIGQGTQEEDRLFSYSLTGHYRMKKTAP